MNNVSVIDVNGTIQMVREELNKDKDDQGNKKDPINKKAKDSLGVYGTLYCIGFFILFLTLSILLGKLASWAGFSLFFVLSGLFILITLIRGAIDVPQQMVVFLEVFGAVFDIIGPGKTLTFWPFVRPKKIFINLAEAMMTVKDEKIELAKQTPAQNGLLSSAPSSVKDEIIVNVTWVYVIENPLLYVYNMPGSKTVEERTKAQERTVLREFQAHVNAMKFTEDQVISIKGPIAEIITAVSLTLSRWGLRLLSFNLDGTEIPESKIKERQAAYNALQALEAEKAKAETAKVKAKGLADAEVIKEKGLADAELEKANGLAVAYFGKKVEDMDDQEKEKFRKWLINKAALEGFTSADKIISDTGVAGKEGVFSTLLRADAAVDNDKNGNNKT
ncbi:MAG: SPFH domain-containing protein [bacterium]